VKKVPRIGQEFVIARAFKGWNPLKHQCGVVVELVEKRIGIGCVQNVTKTASCKGGINSYRDCPFSKEEQARRIIYVFLMVNEVKEGKYGRNPIHACGLFIDTILIPRTYPTVRVTTRSFKR